MSKKSPKPTEPYITYKGFKLFLGPGNRLPPGVDPWIQQLLAQEGNSWLVPIDKNWINDWFNHYGIECHFVDFEYAIEMISDAHGDDWKVFSTAGVQKIHEEALCIYAMLHARWICTPDGMNLMCQKYQSGIYGKCPRYACMGTNLLPYGKDTLIRKHRTKLFCPRCWDLYVPPPEVQLDGAHFGPAFCNAFINQHKQFDKQDEFIPFENRPFGFKRHKGIAVHATNRYKEDVITVE